MQAPIYRRQFIIISAINEHGMKKKQEKMNFTKGTNKIKQVLNNIKISLQSNATPLVSIMFNPRYLRCCWLWELQRWPGLLPPPPDAGLHFRPASKWREDDLKQQSNSFPTRRPLNNWKFWRNNFGFLKDFFADFLCLILLKLRQKILVCLLRGDVWKAF